jgi:CRP-like cAMP-binding protein
MTAISIEDRLLRVPIFANLSAEALAELVHASRVRRFPSGQVIFSEGDPGDHLVVLEEGQLKICRYSSSGEEIVLAVVDPPAIVGELALLDGAPRDATVIAQRSVVVRLVPRDAFLSVLSTPTAVDGLLRTLAGWIRLANRRHADLIGLGVPGRVAKWLLEQAGDVSGEQLRGGAVVELGRTQGQLAAELGTTRSTLNRALQGFADLGLLEVEPGGERVTLRQPREMAAHVQ